MSKTMKPATNGSGHLIPAGDPAPKPARLAVTIGGATVAKRLAALRAERDAITQRIEAYEFVLQDVAAARTAKKQTSVGTIATAIRLTKRLRGRPRGVGETLEAAIETVIKAHAPKPVQSRDLYMYLRAEQIPYTKPAIWRVMRDRGYESKGHGSGAVWVRASKPTIADAKGPKRAAGGFTGKLKAQRAESAALLAQAADTDPAAIKKLFGSKLGIFVTRGYLKKTGDGYTRTAKEFHV